MLENKKVLVADFDGTFTDSAQGLKDFERSIYDTIASDLSLDKGKLVLLSTIFKDLVKDDIDKFNIVRNGKAVCHSRDPLSTIAATAIEVIRSHGIAIDVMIENLIQKLFRNHYPETRPVLRPQAYEVLYQMACGPTCFRDFYIVTNSATDQVQNKLNDMLNSASNDEKGLIFGNIVNQHVIGSANKLHVDDSFDLLPESMDLPGLDRPVYLRRRRYYEILKDILAKTGADWKDLVVVGDLFESDLALPFDCGARICLFLTEYTPDYELYFVWSHERGCVVTDFSQILEF